MRISRVRYLTLLLILPLLSACSASKEQPAETIHKVTVAAVQSKTVTLTVPYSCQIRSHHHIEIRTPEAGVLEAIKIKEGQTVQQNDLLFQLKPTIGKEQRDSEKGYQPVSISAPFDGSVGRMLHQEHSFVQQGEPLATLSDSSLMWVYFNVPEARYLEYQSANLDQHKDDVKIELVLSNGKKFDQPGKLTSIGARFKKETGSIAFRADFPNPDRKLRHGQSGTVLLSQIQNDAIVVPQRATLELLHKRYVYVVDKDDVAHQREIVIQSEVDDEFVVKSGVEVDDKIVVDGLRYFRDGDKVKYDAPQSKNVAANLKHHDE